MKKILVTGVTGFIGSHLALELSKSNEVYGLVKYSTRSNMQRLNEFLGNIILLTCDITDLHAVTHILKSVNPDVIVHLAAMSPVRNSFELPFTYIQANVVGTLNIAHAMLDLPDFQQKKLVYASTAEVYGIQKKQPIREDAVLNPSSPYANTKSMTDTYLRMMTRVYRLNTTVMRCTNTFGRKLDATFFIEYLITTMLRGEKIYIGAPESLRDYMYVNDHVSAYVAAIAHREHRGEAFNVAPGNVISNRDLAVRVAEIMGYPKNSIIYGKYPPNYPMRPIESDQPFIDLDSTKVKKLLGWKPTVDLDRGLEMSVEYWRKSFSGQKKAHVTPARRRGPRA